VDGGCKAAEPDGSGATAVSITPLTDSGDSMAGVSVGAFSTGASTGVTAAGFTLGFLVETLGID